MQFSYLADFLDRHAILGVSDRHKVRKLEQSLSLENWYGVLGQIVQGLSPIPLSQAEVNVIFGPEKIFARHPILTHEEFNVRGLHVMRLILAHYVNFLSLTGSPLQNTFLNEGLVVIEDFLSEQERENVSSECVGFPVSNRVLDGKNTIYNLDRAKYPFTTATMKRFYEPVMKCLARENDDVANKLFIARTFVQRLMNSPADGDVQKVFHSDVFFPALKFWYFPNEVLPESGALEYVPYSAKLTDQLIDWHYHQSIRAAADDYEAWRTYGHKEGSLRVSEDEIGSLGLMTREMTCKPNTLVIGNVFGFHRRGQPNVEAERVAIHGSVRVPNPFSIKHVRSKAA